MEGIHDAGSSVKRIRALAMAGLATLVLGASLTLGSQAQTEDKPNYPVFPPRETLAFTD